MDSNIEYLSLKEINTNMRSKLKEKLISLYKDSNHGWLYHSLKWLEFVDCYEKVSSSGFLIKYDNENDVEGFLSFSIFNNQFKKRISLLENGIGWPILALSANLSVEDELLKALREIGLKEECEQIIINIRNPLVSQKDLIKRQLKVTSLGYKSIIQSNHFIKMF